jgi:UDP-3-O-[3-hydroxymyristoyl] glucosamine N-acyltransferase
VIGSQVRIGAAAGLNGHITVGDGASIGARSGVMRSVAPGQVVSGHPAVDHAQQRRIMVAQTQLPELAKRVRRLEARLAALEDNKEL